MSNPYAPTVQSRLGPLHSSREGFDTWVINSNNAEAFTAGRVDFVMRTTLRCHLVFHEGLTTKNRRISSCVQKISRGGYAQPEGITPVTDTTVSADNAAGPHSGSDTSFNLPAVKSERRARQARFQAKFRGSRRVPYES
jgi:hypothetical protein